MNKFEELIKNPSVIKEYEKTFLLNLFQKLCSKMNKDVNFKNHLKQLYLESFNKKNTTVIIFKKEFNYDIPSSFKATITEWVNAYFSKTNHRKSIDLLTKKRIIERQNNRCAICGEEFDSDLSKVHIDHIIPWKLVGDELKDNYQALCATCNECKSAKTDYIFKSLIGIN